MTFTKGNQACAGERNGNAVLTRADAEYIKTVRTDPELPRRLPVEHPLSIKSLAERFGVTVSAISKIKCGRRWRHLGQPPPPTMAERGQEGA